MSLNGPSPAKEHIDVWDLEVIEDEPDKIHKIISSVMSKNTILEGSVNSGASQE